MMTNAQDLITGISKLKAGAAGTEHADFQCRVIAGAGISDNGAFPDGNGRSLAAFAVNWSLYMHA